MQGIKRFARCDCFASGSNYRLHNAAASNFQLASTHPLVLDVSGDGVKLTNYTDASVLLTDRMPD